MSSASPFLIHATGNWKPGQIRVDWTTSTRKIVPQVEAHIDRAWHEAKTRLGEKLFDGPMCRLERWSASSDALTLTVSRISYRPFLGVDLMNPHLAAQFGREILANPVGVSTALEGSDGWLLLGRRNNSVAYYPNRVHPFAGALEPREELDVFAEVRRELREELTLSVDDIAEIRCMGMIEDTALRQLELVFHVHSARSRTEIESTLDRAEHHATYPIRASAVDVEKALKDPILTPVAMGTLTLWLRR